MSANVRSTTKPPSPGATRSTAEMRELTNYRLSERIGQEELATVYRGVHLTLDRPVEVHLLRRTDWISSSRFQLAARLAARLSHPSILQVIDAGHDEHYGDYIVTPQIESQPLSGVLAAGPIDPLLALRITSQVGAALDYLHDQGIYHRDVRPENILVTPQGVAYLTNFSLAHSPDTPDLSKLDEADFLTPYSAPEQTLTGKVRRESDLYSLGAVLYHALSGQVPPAPGQALRSLAERDAALGGVDRILRKLMAVEPNQRFTSAEQVTTVLRQALRRQIDSSTDDMEESRWEAIAEWLENPVESVIGEMLDHEFQSKSRARADALHRSGAIRRVLDRWSRQAPLKLRKTAFGQLIQPEQIVSYNLYAYELKVYYETRTTPQTREHVHKGGTLNPSAAEPELWTIAVPETDTFSEAPAEPIVIPGSQKVVGCTECNGSTFIPCKSCGTKGVIEKTRRVKDADGTNKTETYSENCPTCRGYGKIPCPRCEGTGQMLQEKVFTWSRHGRVFFNEDDVAPYQKLAVQTQLQEVFRREIDAFEARWYQIAPLKEMLEAAINGGGQDARLIATELIIRGVPLTEVDYKLKEKSHSLALIGFKDEVRGDLALYDLERITLYVMVGVMFLTLLIMFFIH
ncbi:protein kinase [Chloroflexia bacterium SDU3-3]|nr:protein kinase [Chloroflexia bacterium SDU3-3]